MLIDDWQIIFINSYSQLYKGIDEALHVIASAAKQNAWDMLHSATISTRGGESATGGEKPPLPRSDMLGLETHNHPSKWQKIKYVSDTLGGKHEECIDVK